MLITNLILFLKFFLREDVWKHIWPKLKVWNPKMLFKKAIWNYKEIHKLSIQVYLQIYVITEEHYNFLKNQLVKTLLYFRAFF